MCVRVKRISRGVLDPNSYLMDMNESPYVEESLDKAKVWWETSGLNTKGMLDFVVYIFLYFIYDFAFQNILGMTTPLTPCHSPSWARRALVLDKRSCTSVLTTWPLKWWWCSWRMLKLFGCYPLGFFPKSRLLIPKGRVPESGLRPLKQTHLKYLPGCYVATYVQIPDDWKSK